jgi:hypothetical protein
MAWRVTTAVTWMLVFVAWSGVWKASRDLGVATWWLGPDSAPRPIIVMLLPFIAPVAMVALALNNVRRLPFYGLAASALGVVIGIVDLSYVRRLGIVELAIALAAAAVSIASTSGMYRTGEVAATPDTDVGPDAAVPVAPTDALDDDPRREVAG